MRPYRRTKKPVRHADEYFSAWLGKASKATGSLWRDIQIIWFRDPPFPASVRILISAVLSLQLILPILYFLVPPLMTALTVYYLISGDEVFLLLTPLPHLPVTQRCNIYHSYRELFKKTSYRLSMIVSLYDYVQTFRALGAFNLQR